VARCTRVIQRLVLRRRHRALHVLTQQAGRYATEQRRRSRDRRQLSLVGDALAARYRSGNRVSTERRHRPANGPYAHRPINSARRLDAPRLIPLDLAIFQCKRAAIGYHELIALDSR